MTLKLWKTVLPKSRAFSLETAKTLRKFFNGLNYPDFYRGLFDSIYDELDPQKTKNLDRWEEQFYLKSSDLTEQERRDRLAGAWRMTGGQSPHYLQSVLRASGFDVYVHDWWRPQAENETLTMGNVDHAFMGDGDAFMGAQVAVYPSEWNPSEILDNGKILIDGVTPGDSVVPEDNILWRGFVYIAAETMPNKAQVPLSRKAEFEELVLSIFPAEKFIGLCVDYV